VSASYIARWNGTSWSALGSGMNDFVNALTTLPNGTSWRVVISRRLEGVGVNGIARWNGTSWSALGSGMDAAVQSLTTLPNGDLVAGGQFTTAGGVSANRIARWDGTSWSALGSGWTAPCAPSRRCRTATSWRVVVLLGRGRQCELHRALEWHELVGAGFGDEPHRARLHDAAERGPRGGWSVHDAGA
jgi:hypothetical protein